MPSPFVDLSYTIGDATISTSAYTFTDDCSEGLTYTVSVVGEGSLPSWLSHDATSDTLSVQTTTNSDGGVYQVDVTGTAASGVSATLSF